MARRRRRSEDPNPIFIGFVLIAGLAASIQQQQWSIVWLFGSVLAAAIVIGLIVLLLRMQRNERLRQSKITEVDQMTGLQFEEFIKLKLIEHGYTKVSLTTTYDLGIDIIAHKDNEIWGIQAKRYKSPVGLDAVRQVVAALNHYGCTRSMVITNSYFTANARTIAASMNCVLVDRDKLISLLLQKPEGSPSPY